MSIYIEETTYSNSVATALHPRQQDPVLLACKTLVFVSPHILDPFSRDGDRYARSAQPGVVRVSLSPFDNGVAQIADILDQCPLAQSLHIHTTGTPGRLDLGQVILTTDTIERHAWDLQSWFSRLPAYVIPTLVLGHCNVGDGRKGIEFIDHLRHLTGCHIRCLCSANGHHLQLV